MDFTFYIPWSWAVIAQGKLQSPLKSNINKAQH